MVTDILSRTVLKLSQIVV